ncbi:hypothetical protein O6H91_04G122900 [Diphasiastrum complanatum]|uniref:Uncharacterized protein n=1 Tax=Diphasiastrum complanatum TaxID=34168 RepID=A0ACC2E1P9_DIPCM|nr:hypothetical protein O6H91_04G122900 [Diphasiastrum complanatum]
MWKMDLALWQSFHDRHLSNSTFSPTAAVPPGSIFKDTFRPKFILIIGIITGIFWSVFLVVVYAMYVMKRALRRGRLLSELVLDVDADHPEFANSTDNGIDEAIIQSLPKFSFSSLKGNKEGLECAVCLGKYVDTDVLRLLSRCRHAFHIDCVDNWLLSKSNCPLCRCQVTTEDQVFADGTSSARGSLDIVLEQGSTPRRSLETGGFQIIVQRDGAGEPNRRFDRNPLSLLPDNMPSHIGGVGTTPLTDEASSMLRRFSHTIIVSDVLMQHRWSNFVPADLLTLMKKQNLIAPPKDGHGGMNIDPEASCAYEGKELLFSDQRSMSEITGFQRYPRSDHHNACDGKLAQGSHPKKQDEQSQKWLPIVKSTLSWILGKERKQITRPLQHMKGEGHTVFL